MLGEVAHGAVGPDVVERRQRGVCVGGEGEVHVRDAGYGVVFAIVILAPDGGKGKMVGWLSGRGERNVKVMGERRGC